MNKSLAAKLWDGEVPLGLTYWVYGIFFPALISIPGFAVLAFLEESSTLSQVDLMVMNISLSGALLCYSVFWTVAIWRSANKYQGRAIWPGLARVVVVWGWLYLASTLIGLFNAPTSLTVNHSQSSSSAQLDLKEEALGYANAELPEMVSEDVRLDSLSEEDGNLVASYTLIYAALSDIDVAYFVTEMRPLLVSLACAPDFLSGPLVFDHYIFRYRDRAGLLVAEITVRKSEC